MIFRRVGLPHSLTVPQHVKPSASIATSKFPPLVTTFTHAPLLPFPFPLARNTDILTCYIANVREDRGE